MDEAQKQVFTDAVIALRESAREHKRLSSRHRFQARHLMEEFGKLRHMCTELGIEFILIEEDNHGRRGEEQSTRNDS